MIKVYSQPNCVQCNATYRLLDKLGLEYTVVDVSNDKEALDHVRSLGYSAAPVVVVGNTHWSGYQPDKIKYLLEN